jgi:hypothetical protein
LTVDPLASGMSGVPRQPGETDASYRLDRLAGMTVIAAIVLSLALLFVGEPLFWVPFAAGLGIGLPAFAILADRERQRADEGDDVETHPRTDGNRDDDEAPSDEL